MRVLERFAEFLDVRTGDERIARADNNSSFYSRVFAHCADSGKKRAAHFCRARIHGRIVDHQNGNCAVVLQPYERACAGHAHRASRTKASTATTPAPRGRTTNGLISASWT